MQPKLRAIGKTCMEVTLPQLSEHPHLDHLKKQAKELLRLYQVSDSRALSRFRDSLPAAAAKTDDEIVALRLRLHDAQSCLAREYGFSSWGELRVFVEWKNARTEDRARKIRRWLFFVYGGHENRPRPALAARLLAEEPDIARGDPYLSCASGDRTGLLKATKVDRAWVNCKGGPLGMPPLVALRIRALASFLRFVIGYANVSAFWWKPAPILTSPGLSKEDAL